MKILSLKDDKINSEVELFEYPTELSRGRNFILNTQNANMWENGYWSSTPNKGASLNIRSKYRQDISSLQGKALILSFKEGFKFGLAFYDDDDAYVRHDPLQQQESPKIYVIGENIRYIRFNAIIYPQTNIVPGEINNIQPKLERGSTSTPWTPAPEDLSLQYPDFITEFKPSISDRYVLTEELIEYPEELRGGRNLIVRHNEIKNTWIDTQGVISTNYTTSTMSIYIPVIPGDIFTFSKKTDNSPDGGAFRWRWFDENENYLSRRATLSNIFIWVVPNGAYYIQVSYPNSSEAQPKLEKGNKPTDWSPAPEDLGLSYPDNIQSFGISFGNNILINEFIEQ